MNLTTTYPLANGTAIPVIGFGTWQTPNGEVAKEAVLSALQAGYRHIDTAAIYGNEESVGEAIKESGIPREELFITTKLWNDKHSYEGAQEALNESLSKLGVDYVDLYLIHWPNPIAIREDWAHANRDTWRAMEEAYTAGKARAIGVSNFRKHHLTSLLETAEVKPMVNQIFLNPSDMQKEVVAFNNQHNILTEAYSPLGTGKIFEVPEIAKIAKRYNKTVAQVVLRWSLQHGFLPLPKSVTPERIIENSQIFDFNLTASDMDLLNHLHGVAGLTLNPDEAQF